MLAVAASAAGQNAPQAPTPSPAPGSTQSAPAEQPQRETGGRSAAENQITVTGCVAREGDAASNQFVLRNASMAPAAGATAAAGATKPGAAVGTTGGEAPGAKPGGQAGSTSAQGSSYALAGERESSLASMVGQRVEIVGQMARSAGAAGSAGAASGGADRAGQKPQPGEGAQPGQSAQRPAGPAGGSMPELTIASVKPAAGTCN
jgi:hypothetical protein